MRVSVNVIQCKFMLILVKNHEDVKWKIWKQKQQIKIHGEMFSLRTKEKKKQNKKKKPWKIKS